jgi:hypothetical protein
VVSHPVTPKAAATPVTISAQATVPAAKSKPTSKASAAKSPIVVAEPTSHRISVWIYTPIALLAILAGVAYILRDKLQPWTKKTKKQFRTTNKQLRKWAMAKGIL